MKWLIVFLLLLPPVVALEINEVMYNPPGNDNNLEYVEIYSEEEINLSLYIFEDSSASDSLTLLQSMDSVYSLIVENGFNLSGINASVYSAGLTLGDNLNNDHDIILLRKEGEIITTMTYDSSLGGNGNNMSLCANITFYECSPTPGLENVKPLVNASLADNATNSTSLPLDYSSIHLNEILPNPTGLDSETMPDGEWIELRNSGQSVDVTGLELCDQDWHCLSLDKNHLLSGALMNSGSYLVVYVNGQSLLNNVGKEGVRLVHEGVVLDQMEYESSVEETSCSFVENEWVLTEPTQGMENSVPQEHSSKLAFSSIILQKLDLGKDNLTRFGEVLGVRLRVYKGDTDKERVRVTIKNLTHSVDVSFFENYQTSEIMLPLQIPDNCLGTYPSGFYTLTAEGLDVVVQERFLINGTKSCTSSFASTILPQQHPKESIINESSWHPQEEGMQQVYASRQDRIARYGVYGFIIAAVLLVGYFLIER